MYKFDFTKKEVDEIKNKIYLTEQEKEVFEDRLNGLSIVEISMKRNISTATVSRRIRSISKKISKIKKI